MVKINRRLVPIKAHFFFFMAAMGPILPQLSVLGKQIGVAPEIMGVITSVLPIMYVIAKPLFGFVADYFMTFRKFLFMALIMAMTLSYGAFYFVPEAGLQTLGAQNIWNITVDGSNVRICNETLLHATAAECSQTRSAICFIGNDTFQAIFTPATDGNINIRLNGTDDQQLHLSMCLPPSGPSANWSSGERWCHFEESNASCLYYTSTFWLFVVFMCVGTIGFNVTNSISDAICFDMLGETQEDKYGVQRVWGTIGFGVTALLAGIVVDVWTVDAVKSFTPALIIMFIFSGCDLLSVSKLKLPKLSSSESIFKDVWGLITQPPIATFLVFATIAGIIDSFIIYFMFWHLEEVAAETGFMGQIKLIEGCVVAAECLAGEVPFFFYSGKIIKKLGYINCMSLCFFFYAVRLALISWIPNPWYLVVVELFFQGCTYALTYTCIVAYASEVAPPGTSATVQGLIAGMDDGLGFSIGSLIGGIALKRFGGRRSFSYFAIMAILTCLAHIIIRPSSRKRQYLPKTGYQLPAEQITMPIDDKTDKADEKT